MGLPLDFIVQSSGLLKMYKLLLCFVLVGVSVSQPLLKDKEEVRIVGGEDIDISEAPYQVSLLNRGRHSCGGSIIASDVILTAAHCVNGGNPSSFQVRVGSSSSSNGGNLYPVGDIISHKKFSYSEMDYDIAVVWLSKPLEFNDLVAPIDLPDVQEEIEDGELTVVTGWGNIREGGDSPQTLQKALIPKVNAAMCNDAYAPFYAITPRMLCAGVPEGGKDACQGDSGGPLVHDDKLAGVVSWGIGCARPNYPGVYAKVSALRSWIDTNITYLRLKHIFRESLL